MFTTTIQAFRNLAAWFGGREPVVLLAGFILVATAWGFIEIAGEVLEGDRSTTRKLFHRGASSSDVGLYSGIWR